MEDSNEVSLYEIAFDRTSYGSFSFEEMDIDAALSNFKVTNKLKKDVLAELFSVKDEEIKQEEKSIHNEMFDPLFADAARLIVNRQSGSTAIIQREFGLGYKRAGCIMEQLEKAGIVGPVIGLNPREVLISDEQTLEGILARL